MMILSWHMAGRISQGCEKQTDISSEMSVFYYTPATDFVVKYKVLKKRKGDRHADQRDHSEDDAGYHI